MLQMWLVVSFVELGQTDSKSYQFMSRTQAPSGGATTVIKTHKFISAKAPWGCSPGLAWPPVSALCPYGECFWNTGKLGPNVTHWLPTLRCIWGSF